MEAGISVYSIQPDGRQVYHVYSHDDAQRHGADPALHAARRAHIHNGNQHCCARPNGTTYGTHQLFQHYLHQLQAQLKHNDAAYQALYTGQHDGRVHWTVDQASGRMSIAITNPQHQLQVHRIIICQNPNEAAHFNRVPENDFTTYVQGAQATNAVFQSMITHIRHVVYPLGGPQIGAGGGAPPPPDLHPDDGRQSPRLPRHDEIEGAVPILAPQIAQLNTLDACRQFAEQMMRAIAEAVARAQATVERARRGGVPNQAIAEQAIAAAGAIQRAAQEAHARLNPRGGGAAAEPVLDEAQRDVNRIYQLENEAREIATRAKQLTDQLIAQAQLLEALDEE